MKIAESSGRPGQEEKKRRKEEGKSDVEAAHRALLLHLDPVHAKSGRKEKGEGEREAEDALENNTDFVPIGASSSGESTRSDTDAPDRIAEVNQRSSGGSHRSNRTAHSLAAQVVIQEGGKACGGQEGDTSSESTSTNGRENGSGEDGPDAVVASLHRRKGGVLPVAVLTCGMAPSVPDG